MPGCPCTCVSESTAVIVERLGEYHRVLSPGFHWLNPFLESTMPAISLRTQSLSVVAHSITKDKVHVSMEADVLWKVHDGRSRAGVMPPAEVMGLRSSTPPAGAEPGQESGKRTPPLQSHSRREPIFDSGLKGSPWERMASPLLGDPGGAWRRAQSDKMDPLAPPGTGYERGDAQSMRTVGGGASPRSMPGDEEEGPLNTDRDLLLPETDQTKSVRDDAVYRNFYAFADTQQILSTWAEALLVAALPTKTLDEAFSSSRAGGGAIAEIVQRQMQERSLPFGILVPRVNVTRLHVERDTRWAMNEVNRQQRLRAAMTHEVKGEYAATVLEAEAESECLHLSGQGLADERKEVMRGLATNVARVDGAILASGGTVSAVDIGTLLLVQQCFDAVQDLAQDHKLHGRKLRAHYVSFRPGDSLPLIEADGLPGSSRRVLQKSQNELQNMLMGTDRFDGMLEGGK